jgi:hypothetical protein
LKSNIILDSGAFSAFQNKTSVCVQEYIDFIKENDVKLFFNLDVIGDAEASWKNQRLIEKAGLVPIPIFHANSHFKYLNRCMEYDYMAIGGMASGSHENTRRAFLDSCFSMICDTPDRLPKTKVHGLGLASPLLVTRYPFYSCDTASGIHYGRYGIIIIPSKRSNGKLDYLQPPHSLYVTERSTAKQTEGRHFSNVSKDEQKWIINYVKERGFDWGKVSVVEVGADYTLGDNEKFLDKSHSHIEKVEEDGIISNGILRDYFNIDFYMMMEKSVPEWPFPFKLGVNRIF